MEKTEEEVKLREEYPIYVKTGLFEKHLIGTATITKRKENGISLMEIIPHIAKRFLLQKKQNDLIMKKIEKEWEKQSMQDGKRRTIKRRKT